jgi:hypothetical protein
MTEQRDGWTIGPGGDISPGAGTTLLVAQVDTEKVRVHVYESPPAIKCFEPAFEYVSDQKHLLTNSYRLVTKDEWLKAAEHFYDYIMSVRG